ncbi:hypothetical protein AMECASPLE_020983 [Ameca splendens]|uniref:Uncharacterized protein n=1 Tax=Ameca splendens TaxID=208324 RepID=A0ABV0XSA4_9TELE
MTSTSNAASTPFWTSPAPALQVLSREESEATEASASDQDDGEPEEPVPGGYYWPLPSCVQYCFCPSKKTQW